MNLASVVEIDRTSEAKIEEVKRLRVFIRMLNMASFVLLFSSNLSPTIATNEQAGKQTNEQMNEEASFVGNQKQNITKPNRQQRQFFVLCVSVCLSLCRRLKYRH